MHMLNLKITDEQKEALFKNKEEKDISVSSQIRTAIDEYLQKN